MSALGLVPHCERILDELVAISHRIRRSALTHTNNQNLILSDRLRSQLDTIRISADAILEVFTKASLANNSLDDRLIDWLFSGELHLCVHRLKEMDIMLNRAGQARSSRVPSQRHRAAEDKLTAAMAFFEKHSSIFHFLLNPDVWNHEILHHQPQSNASSVMDIQRHPQETETEYFTASEYDEPLSNPNQNMTTRDKKALHEKLDEVLRWLAPLDCMQKHNHTLQLRQEGTCTWLPETDVFKNWRTSWPRFLWVHGKAGCGKSVLVASTIEHLKKSLRTEEVVLFFYFDFRDKRSTDPTEMLRSLLSQLYRHIRDLGVNPGDVPQRILQQKSEGSLSLNDLDKLCDLLLRSASCLLYDPLVMIDALDECADLDALLHALGILKLGNVRLFVTSRPHQVVMDHFRGLGSLSLETMTEVMAGDIALHIRREVDSHERLRSTHAEMKEEMRMKLNKKAEGRFRWVQCQLDALKQCGCRKQLREALDNLPNELESTYERILGAIDERTAEGMYARCTLTWLAVALEPLRLSQIVQGISVKFETERGTQELGHTLIRSLSSLVRHHEDTDIITFSHFSVKEYLMGPKTLATYHIIPHDAHAEAALISMRYLSFVLNQSPTHGSVATLTSFQTLSYVLSSGFNHLAYVDPESTAVLEALKSLGSEVRHHPSHWECLVELREEHLRWPYPPWPTSRHDFVPYILIAYSSPGLLRSFLSRNGPVNARVKTNPVVYAADLWRTEHAIVLLECGADVHARGFVVDDSYHAMPLDMAIDRGEDLLVGEILQRGCLLTPEVLTVAICMPWCSVRVLLQLMQTDTFIQWVHNIGDERLYRGVFNSARPGAGDRKQADEDHVALARILCQIGVDLSVDSPFGAELLERAIHAAHVSMLELLLPQEQPPPPRFLLIASTGDTPETVSVVSLLLRKGVDVNTVSDGREDTALHLAAMCPLETRGLELVGMLIAAGCNLHARNSRGQTVLDIAIRREHILVADLLLSHGVSCPSDILLTLRRHWTPSVVKSMIHKGSDVHRTRYDGNTVLHLALTEYDEPRSLELVTVFIEAGCDPVTHDSAGRSVLDIAMKRGYTLVVDFLLSRGVPYPPDTLLTAMQRRCPPRMIPYLFRKGVNVESTTSSGNSLLHLAVLEYAEPICLNLVKMFIEAGCDLNHRNSRGQTVYEIAIRRKYMSVVDVLLSHNLLPPDILLVALQKLVSTVEMIKYLTRKGANVHSATSDGNTVLHLAVTEYDESTCLELVKIFMEAGCNPLRCNTIGDTILEVATKRRYSSVVDFPISYCLSCRPDFLITQWRLWTPQIVESMIHNGADVHSTTSDGNTVLHFAVNAPLSESKCLRMVKLFTKAGCNPVTRNSRGETISDIAIDRGYPSVVDYLVSHDVPISRDLIARCEHWTPNAVRYMLDKGANVHAVTSDGNTVLHLAVTKYGESTCLELVKIFMEAGCDPLHRNTIGDTVLEVATKRKYPRVVDFLLSYYLPCRPDLLITQWKCWTPRIVELMIRNGANVHSTVSDGNTVLHFTANAPLSESECLHMVKLFTEAGCNPVARNSRGETISDIAIDRGYPSVVDYVASHDFPVSRDLIALCDHWTPAAVRYMLDNGANVHAVTSDGNTVLHLAVVGYSEPTCLSLVKIFIQAGCDPLARNSKAESGFEVAALRGYGSVMDKLLPYDVPCPRDLLITTCRHWTPQRVLFMIRNGASVHSTLPDGTTVLRHVVITYDESLCLELIKIFIQAGCGLMITDRSGRTALALAIIRGRDTVTEYLLSHISTPDFRMLTTALGVKTSLHIIRMLASKWTAGADVTTSQWETLLELARTSYTGPAYLEILEALCPVNETSIVGSPCIKAEEL